MVSTSGGKNRWKQRKNESHYVAVLAIGAAKRRKEILFGRNSVAPDGVFGDGALFPAADAVGPLPPHLD